MNKPIDVLNKKINEICDELYELENKDTSDIPTLYYEDIEDLKNDIKNLRRAIIVLKRFDLHDFERICPFKECKYSGCV